MSDNELSLRDTIEASFDAVEAGAANTEAAPVVEAEAAAPESNQASVDQAAADKARDEKGRFASKPAEAVKAEAAPVNQQAVAPVAEPAIQRPTTWKKEHMPAWERLARGEAPTPAEAKKLAEYVVQREREFATGVSTYRAEAQNAKHLTEALAPYMPTIQQRGMSQPQFIAEMGRTHEILVRGSPQQKLQAISELARSVGVPLEAVVQQQGGRLDPVVPKLMQYIQSLEGKVNNVASWREQQEQAAVQSELAKFNDESKYPHFQTVKTTMGQLLMNGLAKGTDEAYHKAVRMNEDTWAAEQARQAQLSAPVINQPSVAEAKAKVLSPRSVAPSGAPKAIDPKDLRAQLENAFDQKTRSSRV
jgi:hypothetical protein